MPTKKILRRRRRSRGENPPHPALNNPRANFLYKTKVVATWLTPMGEITITHGFDASSSRRIRRVDNAAGVDVAGVDAKWFFELCMSSASCVGATLIIDGKSQGSRDGPAS